MSEEDARRHNEQHHGLTDQQKIAPTETQQVEGGTNVHHKSHHHIHETIQPVVQRETVSPSVIHTTKNVHEHHTDQPVVHDQTVEPTLSINQFKDKVGNLEGGHTTSHHHHMKPNVIPHGSGSGGDVSSFENSGSGVGTTGNMGVGSTGQTGTGKHAGTGMTDGSSGMTDGSTGTRGSGLKGDVERDVTSETSGMRDGTGSSGMRDGTTSSGGNTSNGSPGLMEKVQNKAANLMK
jgi:hypothetical protein